MENIKWTGCNLNGLDIENLKNPFSIVDDIAKDIIKQKDNEMAMQFVKSIGKLLVENGVKPKITEYTQENNASNKFEMRYGCTIDGLDFTEHDKRFKDEITKLKSSLSQTESQRIELLNRCDELEKQLETMESLPVQPIEVAKLLINSEYEYETSEIQRRFLHKGDTDTCERYNVDELEQIAEHLLIYCKHNKGCEE
jgi:hypothetical protein